MAKPSRAGAGGAPIWIILALVFPAMVVSTASLAYYGYQYTDDVSRRMQDAFRETAGADAVRLSDATESRIDLAAREVLERIVLPDDGEGRESDACQDSPGPAADSYLVMRFTSTGVLRVICVGGSDLPLWRASAGASTAGVYLKSLDFSSVQTGNFRYLHQRFEKDDALIAYMGKQTPGGKNYFVAARMAARAVTDIIEDELSKLGERRRIIVLDQTRRRVAGGQLVEQALAEPRFSYEASFGKALYAWDIQVVPADLEALRAQERKQRVLGPALVILSSSIIAAGLVIVWLGIMAERRASRLRSDFIANVSHELKTPLSLIRMFGEMISTGRHKGAEAVQEYGEIITRESERLSHLIDNVLDFSRLERGKASYHFAPADPAEVVERALDLCRYRLDKEKLRMVKQIEAGLPRVRLDENAVTLGVLNLVDNAVKYAAGGGSIEVTLARVPGQVCLRVRDFGPGVAGPERERIFERFYRASNAREGNVRGSGIGLSLVKNIAEAHGGRATAETPVDGGIPGPGIAFCMYFPASGTQEIGTADGVESKDA